MAGDTRALGDLIPVHRAGLRDHIAIQGTTKRIAEHGDARDLLVGVGTRRRQVAVVVSSDDIEQSSREVVMGPRSFY